MGNLLHRGAEETSTVSHTRSEHSFRSDYSSWDNINLASINLNPQGLPNVIINRGFSTSEADTEADDEGNDTEADDEGTDTEADDEGTDTEADDEGTDTEDDEVFDTDGDMDSTKSPDSLDCPEKKYESDLASSSVFGNDENYVQAGMHCLLPPTKLLLTSEKQEFVAFGMEINIPSGAIAPEEDCCLAVAVFINTAPCSYPCDVQKISPVLMLKPDKEVSLLKPIHVTIPHFLRGKIDSEDNLAHIGVLKANDTSKNKNEKLRFEKLPECKILHFGTSKDGDETATFEISHFCFFQLYVDSSLQEKVSIKPKYCLCRLEPNDSAYPRTYYYVLTYKLEMFVKSVDKQFPTHERTKVLEFQFKDSQKKQIIVKNSFQQYDNWNVTFEDSMAKGSEALDVSLLERWGDTDEDLKLDIECGLYPPKFKLKICPKNQQRTSYDSIDVCVPFKGICKVASGAARDPAAVVDHIIVCAGGEKATQLGSISEGQTNIPEYNALKSELSSITELISTDIPSIAAKMLEKNLIPESMHASVISVNGKSPSVKAAELMRTILTQVRIQPTTFDIFINVLKEAGTYTSNLIEKITAHLPASSDTQPETSSSVNNYELLHHLNKSDSEFRDKIPTEKT